MLCVGARFDDRITGAPTRSRRSSKKIHIDIDRVVEARNIRVDVPDQSADC